ncbi:MAG: Rid family detoxifying hydrolase [Fimbriimonadaceae bacterium]
MRRTHFTAKAPAAIGPYSQAVTASGRVTFISGQIPLRPDGTLVEGSVAEQTEQVLANLKAVLAAANALPEHVVKTTIFLSSMEHFATVNEIYAKVFPKEPPARSTVAVAGLPRGVDVEIEAIAMLPGL